MKLKTQIGEEIRKADRYVRGWHKEGETKNKNYYRGIIDALMWVQTNKDATNTLMGEDVRYMGYNPYRKNYDEVDYAIHIHRTRLLLDERGIKNAVANNDYNKFMELISADEKAVVYGVEIDVGGYSSKIDIKEENFHHAIHCVFFGE